MNIKDQYKGNVKVENAFRKAISPDVTELCREIYVAAEAVIATKRLMDEARDNGDHKEADGWRVEWVACHARFVSLSCKVISYS